MVHWGSTLTPLEKAAMQKWIRDERLKIFGDMVGEEYAISPIAPIPDKLPADPAKVELGYKLFHDVRLSTDNTVSCATCHSLEKAGTDNLATSTGDDFYNRRILEISAKGFNENRLDLKFIYYKNNDSEKKEVYKTSTTLELLNMEHNKNANPLQAETKNLTDHIIYYRNGEFENNHPLFAFYGTVCDD